MNEKIKTKICSKCKIEKEIINFGVDNKKKDGLKYYCKECRKTESNKESDKLRKKNWYEQNRELSIKRACDRQIIKRNERNYYLKVYYKKNPHVYMWRSLLYRTLKGKLKDDDTVNLLGYTSLELKQHIESLFTEGMTWDNYGEWHVDHKIPIDAFDSNIHPSIVNALSNLQPLWATTREINGIIYEGNLNKGIKHG